MTIHRYEEAEGGDKRPLLTYLLFAGQRLYPNEGVRDLIATADTIDELKSLPEANLPRDHESAPQWWQIVEKDTLKIIEEKCNSDL